MAHRWKLCTNRELNNLFVEIKNEARNLGYPIDDYRLYNLYIAKSTRWYGQAWKDQTGYHVVLNENYLANPQAARNTLIHEIAHILTFGDHHGKKWKACGDRIGAKWGETVTRCSEHEGVELPGTDKEYKYLIQCPKCKKILRYQRMTNIVKNPSNYFCTKCHQDLVRIQ